VGNLRKGKLEGLLSGGTQKNGKIKPNKDAGAVGWLKILLYRDGAGLGNQGIRGPNLLSHGKMDWDLFVGGAGRKSSVKGLNSNCAGVGGWFQFFTAVTSAE